MFLRLHVVNVTGVQGGGTFCVVSLSEKLTALPGLKGAAGYAPVVHSLDGGANGKGMWWAFLEYGERVVLRVGYNTDIDGSFGEYSVGPRWAFGR